MIYLANFFLGVSDQIGCIKVIPELLRLFNQQDPSSNKQAFYNQKASVLYNLNFFVAEFVGPLISGVLFDLFGYERGVHIYILATFCTVIVPYVLLPERESV